MNDRSCARRVRGAGLCLLVLTGFASAGSEAGRMVIANRGSGNVSVVDVATDVVVATRALPPGPDEPEPMYVAYARASDQVFVGDRANDRVVAFDADTFEVLGVVRAGEGVFHMATDARGRELWVVNDIDDTLTVIDPNAHRALATVAVPADLVALGGTPHDVLLGPLGRLAYVSVQGVAGGSDQVVQFDTSTRTEIGRAAVGQAPHVALAFGNHRLFVSCQATNEVHVLDRFSLAALAVLDVPGAHGTAMARRGGVFYTTNLPGGGAQGLITVDARREKVAGVTDTPFVTPHNVATTPSGEKVYVTHSGPAAVEVSVYRTTAGSAVPVLVTTLAAGLNPFGLEFVP